MTPHDRDAWITGIGLVSNLGDGCEATWQGLMTGRPSIDEASFAPYPVHRLAAVDFTKQIPRSEQRLMDGWQRTGTYAAGLALESAGLKGCTPVLSRTDLVVVAGGGERDTALDCTVLTQSRTAPDRARLLNEKLMNDLRPTLFLSQLSNMLAGNISIVHGVTGSSRTFLGEAAGIEAIRTAQARVMSGQSDIVLVGGAHSGERKDMLLFCEAGGLVLKGEYAPVFERQARGGGLALGSFGAFLVIESRAHSSARGSRPLRGSPRWSPIGPSGRPAGSPDRLTTSGGRSRPMRLAAAWPCCRARAVPNPRPRRSAHFLQLSVKLTCALPEATSATDSKRNLP